MILLNKINTRHLDIVISIVSINAITTDVIIISVVIMNNVINLHDVILICIAKKTRSTCDSYQGWQKLPPPSGIWTYCHIIPHPSVAMALFIPEKRDK